MENRLPRVSLAHHDSHTSKAATYLISSVWNTHYSIGSKQQIISTSVYIIWLSADCCLSNHFEWQLAGVIARYRVGRKTSEYIRSARRGSALGPKTNSPYYIHKISTDSIGSSRNKLWPKQRRRVRCVLNYTALVFHLTRLAFNYWQVLFCPKRGRKHIRHRCTDPSWNPLKCASTSLNIHLIYILLPAQTSVRKVENATLCEDVMYFLENV